MIFLIAEFSAPNPTDASVSAALKGAVPGKN